MCVCSRESVISVEELRGTFVRLRPIRVEDAELTFLWRQTERAALLNRGAQTVAEQAAWITARPASEHNFIIALLSTGHAIRDGQKVVMAGVGAGFTFGANVWVWDASAAGRGSPPAERVP